MHGKMDESVVSGVVNSEVAWVGRRCVARSKRTVAELEVLWVMLGLGEAVAVELPHERDIVASLKSFKKISELHLKV